MNPQKSKTDWERVKREAAQDSPIAFDAATDGYDPNDPAAVDAHWAGAKVRTRGPNKRPKKELVAVRYSPDVLAAFRASGPGWQTRMDAALRDWLKTHSPA